MTSILTAEEQRLFDQYNKRRLQHNKAQAQYRLRLKARNPNYNVEYNAYMRNYNAKRSRKVRNIRDRLMEQDEVIIPDAEVLLEITQQKQNKRGRKRRADMDIVPSYLIRQQQGKPLKSGSLNDYLGKANVIQKKFKNQSLSPQAMAELEKLMTDDPTANQAIILREMDYLNDVDNMVHTLKGIYPNPRSLKSYITVLAVITSHLKDFHQVYQQLTRISIEINKRIQEKRDDNELTGDETERIIPLDKPTILNGLDKLKDMREKLIFGLYTLQPCRRLEYRFMRITKETDIDKLDDKDDNYLVITPPYKFIFNNYKTNDKYGQQEIPVMDNDLINLIKKYIAYYKLKIGDYLIGQTTDKNKVIAEPNFSNKLTQIFKKAYGVHTSLDYIRKSHIIAFLDQPKKLSNNEKKQFAYWMSHSTEEQTKYYKIVK
jgi:hypothetical protein